MTWIEPSSLGDLIKGVLGPKKPHIDYAIVDVRDDDFMGGNIPHCIHIPSSEFEQSVDELVERLKDVPLVVFHCFLSQQRGPKAARIFLQARDEKLPDLAEKQEIAILHGGFSEFQHLYKGDPELVENWDANVWDPSIL